MLGLKAAKESVNQAQNEQGFYNSLRSAMAVQQLSHAHNNMVHGMGVDPAGGEVVRKLNRAEPLDE
jgi:enoyl-CoA hydratase